jgi:putative DNA methylase
MTDRPRLIEHAFPLKQASLDSVHEKNVRHGHISTLHIWPARRPLAACRAALIATLLPDPGTPEERKKLVERIGGTVVKRVEKKKLGGKTIEVEKEETVGGVLHWGRESSPDMDWFREEIKKAYGGRAPKVLDPFAGGGAIPLEAMRLGCEVTAIDINPVAWFILKCTLEYPQKLAGQKRPLPDFVLSDRDFMEGFFKSQGLKGATLRSQLEKVGLGASGDQKKLEIEGLPASLLEADLAWHVRAWGSWVLREARKELARFYPVYADFEPLQAGGSYEKREMKLVPLNEDGASNIGALNSEFSAEYLGSPINPRWVAKPTVAYLWARTVKCKNCRATLPLLKTRWLCKKDKKRVLLTMEPNPEKTGVIFGVDTDLPVVGGNAAQRREYDKRAGAGTMSRSGATCPCCGTIVTMEDIRLEGLADRLGHVMTAVVMDTQRGKEYRPPRTEEVRAAELSGAEVDRVFATIPFGIPDDPLPGKEALGFRVPLYGLDRWAKLFTGRQLLALGVFTKCTRSLGQNVPFAEGKWRESLLSYLVLLIDRTANRGSTQCMWGTSTEKIEQTFARFALPIHWDFPESNPVFGTSGSFLESIEWVAKVVEHLSQAEKAVPEGKAIRGSAATAGEGPGQFDLVLTDPPYYDAIAYSDLMDFFYVWLRRSLNGVSPEIDAAFKEPLAPKWDYETSDGEFIDDSSRFGGDRSKSKVAYEDGMSRAFQKSAEMLTPQGRLVIVFAHKKPDAWETLVSAMIRAGFVVDGSWPIATEMRGGVRNLGRASLASSVWLVCKKRPHDARPGWDNQVLEEMREKIGDQLREFWDAGIRGPDFVWAATGPALEAYSKHPVVKKANEPGKLMEVSEFLQHVRRMVVDFVVGRVLSKGGGTDAASGLDDVTTYYLLHRNDFGMGDAPAGACILYAVSCNLSDSELANKWDILLKTGGKAYEEAEEDEAEEDPEVEREEGSGSKVRLKTWQQRKDANMGYKSPGGGPPPLIDMAHRLIHLWRAGDQVKVDEYLEERGLRGNAIFHQLLQALIELSEGEERSLLESISNHIGARGAIFREPVLPYGAAE